MLGIGRTHFENVRNHLATNGIIPRVHGNVKNVPRWKTKITIDIAVATAVKNFLENYAEIHGLPSPGRNVNRCKRRNDCSFLSSIYLANSMSIISSL